MAFSHGLDARIYLDVQNLSAYVEEVDPDFERELATFQTLADTWQRALKGRRKFTLALAGLYDGTDDGFAEDMWDILEASTNKVFAFLPYGDSLGYCAYCGQVKANSVGVPVGDDVTKLPVGAIGSDAVDRCAILHTLMEESASDSEVDVDGSAASSNGGGAYLTIASLSAGATLTVTIEESDNEVDWSTLASFSAQTDEATEVVEVTGAVERYLRASWTLTGSSPTATFFVGFGRR